MFGSQLTFSSDASWETLVFDVARELWDDQDRFAILKSFDCHVFLLVDGRPGGGEILRIAPGKITISRRGTWIYVKGGIAYEEWFPLDRSKRLILAQDRLCKMLEAVCDRAAAKLGVDKDKLDEFMADYTRELKHRVDSAASTIEEGKEPSY